MKRSLGADAGKVPKLGSNTLPTNRFLLPENPHSGGSSTYNHMHAGSSGPHAFLRTPLCLFPYLTDELVTALIHCMLLIPMIPSVADPIFQLLNLSQTSVHASGRLSKKSLIRF